MDLFYTKTKMVCPSFVNEKLSGRPSVRPNKNYTGMFPHDYRKMSLPEMGLP